MTHLDSGREALRPEEWAAIVNAGVLVVAPFLVSGMASLLEEERAIAVATGVPDAVAPMWLARAVFPAVMLAPFAAVAAWRTHVHARHLRLGHGGAWRGVVEAVALGAGIPLVLLLRVLVERPVSGAPYVAAYVVIGAGAGLVVGLVLAALAVVVVRLSARVSSP